MIKNHYSKFRKKSNILLTCEHASRRIPRKYGLLGLTRKQLQKAKDWNDVGSLEVMRGLEKKLGASYIYSNISRLVIDYNRRIDAKNKYENGFHSCPLKKELMIGNNGEDILIDIPKNVFSNKREFKQEEKKRFKKYVIPYQSDGLKIIKRMLNFHQNGYLIMIHSFYPKYNGYNRKEDIGVLFGNAKKSAGKIIGNLRKNSSLKIGSNKPWSLNDADKSIFHQVEEEMENIDLIVFDINNRHLQNKKDIKKIVNLITNSIREVIDE